MFGNIHYNNVLHQQAKKTAKSVILGASPKCLTSSRGSDVISLLQVQAI